MKRIELEVEHSYKNRFVGKHRLKPTDDMTVLGSSRNAQIRLLGDAVAGVHATLEYTEDGWTLCDMGSEKGTWVRKRPVVLQPIHGTISANIGGHVIKLTPHEINSDIFKTDKVVKSSGNHMFHQVILRKRGMVVESHLLEQGEEFRYPHDGTFTVVTAPTEKDKWTTKKVGEVTIQSRLTSSDQMELSNKDKMAGLVDPSLRAPLGGAVALLLLFFAIILFAPLEPNEELVELKPEKNRYTRMIFDAKKIKKTKKKAIKITKNIKGQNKKVQPKAPKKVASSSAKKKSSKKAAKVVSKIKAAGLGQLIGKISKRAAKTATFVQASGRSPDSKGSGRALGLAGSATLGKTGKIGGSAGQKIGGVTTAGKGGGSSAYKGIGGLAQGNVGNAEVGVLEEETEVQGGLEREVIARYIKSQLGQIRYCYERQLSASPDLYGKVKVKFTIGAAGSVVAQAINATSLKNAMVEGCILRRIAGWRFPKPEGGTQVNVSYPFLFKSTK